MSKVYQSVMCAGIYVAPHLTYAKMKNMAENRCYVYAD